MPRLTPAEQQEVIRYLEADKPLPEKYRFLLFDDKREVELVWNGKTNEVCNVVLPFQVIEQVDEPRVEGGGGKDPQSLLFSLDERGRQLKGWTNKLIWGDNKLILSSLKNGPLREEIEEQGGLKLIYIDPPFDVGADFSMDIEVGDGGDTLTKRPGILEEIAYRDTWGRGADSFLAMIYERLILMRDLLAEDGSIYVHCDWRVNSYIRQILEELFGPKSYRNEVVWKRTAARSGSESYNTIHDLILFYTKSSDYTWNVQYTPYSQNYMESFFGNADPDGRRYQIAPITAPGTRTGTSGMPWRGIDPNRSGRHWAIPKYVRPLLKSPESENTLELLDDLERIGRIIWPKKEGGVPRFKQYADEMEGVELQSVWTDINPVSSQANERLGYDTQKPETLLERIIKASSNPGDLVADFFVGSGTTAAVAEKLGRKWIATDLGKFAIHTTRKRMIGVQRQLKAEGKDYRAFEVLNLGRYERQHYVGLGNGGGVGSMRAEDLERQRAAKEAEFVELILTAYRAEKVSGYPAFQGKKAGRLVAVGPVNLPVTRLFVEEIIVECRKKSITKVDILGFEFEMGLFPNVLDEARAKGIDIAAKYIPAEVFDKRAVEKNQVVFHDVSFIEVKPIVKGNSVAVELTDFSVFYNQDSIAAAEAALAETKKGGSKIVVEKGQIVKVTKDAKGVVEREVLTEKWTDWVDYWAVDFDYESKRELIRVRKEVEEAKQDGGSAGASPSQSSPSREEWEEQWTGDYIFENEWQSFRTKKERKLELVSAFRETDKKRVKVAVKVVDIFGNDTMTIVEVNMGNGRGKGK